MGVPDFEQDVASKQVAKIAIEKYVKVMGMQSETIKLNIHAPKDYKGNPFVVAVADDRIPLLVADGEAKIAWRGINGFTDLTSRLGKRIGTEASQYYFKNDRAYRNTLLSNFDFAVTSGTIFKQELFNKIPNKKLTPEEVVNLYDWEKADNILSAAATYRIPLRIHHLFGGYYEQIAPQWLKSMSNDELADWMNLHTKAISERVKRHGTIAEDVDVYNEAFFGTTVGEYVAARLGVERALELGFRTARQHFGEGINLNYLDNVYYGKNSNVPNNIEAQHIFNVIKSLRQKGVPINNVKDHGHKVLRDFKSAQDAEEYKKQLAELASLYKSIGMTFEIGESDLNINNATTEQLAFAQKLFQVEIELLNQGIIGKLAYWGFTEF